MTSLYSDRQICPCISLNSNPFTLYNYQTLLQSVYLLIEHVLLKYNAKVICYRKNTFIIRHPVQNSIISTLSNIN